MPSCSPALRKACHMYTIIMYKGNLYEMLTHFHALLMLSYQSMYVHTRIFHVAANDGRIKVSDASAII